MCSVFWLSIIRLDNIMLSVFWVPLCSVSSCQVLFAMSVFLECHYAECRFPDSRSVPLLKQSALLDHFFVLFFYLIFFWFRHPTLSRNESLPRLVPTQFVNLTFLLNSFGCGVKDEMSGLFGAMTVSIKSQNIMTLSITHAMKSAVCSEIHWAC